jgi:hypothetical protein
MILDGSHFTPISALAGGALIGVAAGLFALVNGRIAGISGITAGLLLAVPGDIAWRAAFVLGLLAAPWAWSLVAGPVHAQMTASDPLTALAGMIVGIGTRYGSGCTSGHGVCGLSRMSPRSLVATAAFMATGIATVYVLRHVLEI